MKLTTHQRILQLRELMRNPLLKEKAACELARVERDFALRRAAERSLDDPSKPQRHKESA